VYNDISKNDGGHDMARVREESRELIDFKTKFSVYLACGQRCVHCGRRMAVDDLTVEHVIPLNKGGKNEVRNYAVLCKPCNQAKSDYVIAPVDYYQYAPEEKKKELQTLFGEYLDTVDWLSHDNLFMTDSFDVRPGMPVIKPRARKIIFVPTTAHIERMDAEKAFEWLMVYRAHLRAVDRDLMLDDVSRITTPYYMVTVGGKEFAVISVYVQRTNMWTPIRDECAERNVIFVDLFTNPEMKYNPVRMTDFFVQNFIGEIIREVQHTLAQKNLSKNTAIELITRSPRSDDIMYETLSRGSHRKDFPNLTVFQYCPEYINEEDPDDAPTIIASDHFVFQGSFADFVNIAKERGMTTQEFKQSLDWDMLQSPLDERLSESKEIPDADEVVHKKKPTKSDKKKKGSRKRK
jgi:hypothetical protein